MEYQATMLEALRSGNIKHKNTIAYSKAPKLKFNWWRHTGFHSVSIFGERSVFPKLKTQLQKQKREIQKPTSLKKCR
jgi:hypothetical protein